MGTEQYTTVSCDECTHKFELKPKIMKITEVAKDIEKTFFLCPKCKHEYVVMYQDQEFKNNLNEMNVIRKLLSESTDDNENKLLTGKYNKLYKRNSEISKKYKKIYGS